VLPFTVVFLIAASPVGPGERSEVKLGTNTD
jgi:hypothetical protein